jgi:hypothetical protein
MIDSISFNTGSFKAAVAAARQVSLYDMLSMALLAVSFRTYFMPRYCIYEKKL